MLNRLHDIREIANRFLADVIDVTKAVQPDPRHPSNFMEGHAELVTPFNKYQLSVYSPHGTQPPQAPAECRSLGTILFRDPVDDTTVIGPRCERVLLDISQRVHYREYKDAIAVARRELAEAGPDAVKPAQSKLSDLVSRAAKWGITGDAVPMAPPTKEVMPPGASTASPVPVAAAAAAVAAPIAPALPADDPMLGLPIRFFHNPHEGSAGMSTVPGVVTRVWSNGQIGLQMFVDDHDIQHRPKVHRRGTDAGNGRVHQTGCWDVAPWFAALVSRLDALEASLGAIEALAAENKQLADRVGALEAASAKPRRAGRAAKLEGGSEAEAGEPPNELDLAANSEAS